MHGTFLIFMNLHQHKDLKGFEQNVAQNEFCEFYNKSRYQIFQFFCIELQNHETEKLVETSFGKIIIFGFLRQKTPHMCPM